jgi:serine/threonine protein kinase
MCVVGGCHYILEEYKGEPLCMPSTVLDLNYMDKLASSLTSHTKKNIIINEIDDESVIKISSIPLNNIKVASSLSLHTRESAVIGEIDDESVIKVPNEIFGEIDNETLERIPRIPINDVRNLLIDEYGKLLLVLAVMKLLGIVHRDIRPSNVLKKKKENEESYLYTLIDFGYCCDSDVEYPFAGGLSCASPNVLYYFDENLKKFAMNNNDDMFSWLRCWILSSNYDLYLSYNMGRWAHGEDFRSVTSFWKLVTCCPEIEHDGKIIVEDVWDFCMHYPDFFLFVSSFISKKYYPPNINILSIVPTKRVGNALLKIGLACIKYIRKNPNSDTQLLKDLVNRFTPDGYHDFDIEFLNVSFKVRNIFRSKDNLDENENELKKLEMCFVSNS